MTQAVVVTVVRFWLDWLNTDVPRVVRTWEITCGAYRALIEECPCGLHGALSRGQYRLRRTGKRTNCLCRNEACRNNPERKGVCHGWHQARIDDMVAQIERPKTWKPAAVGVPKVAPHNMVGLRGYRWQDIYG